MKAMNRRQILKVALLAPLLGLFKSRKSTGLTLDKLKECRDELEKNSLKPDENGMISLTSGTSGGDYTCWSFLDEEPEIYNGKTYHWFHNYRKTN